MPGKSPSITKEKYLSLKGNNYKFMSLEVSGRHHSEKTKEKLRKARLERKKLLGYINSPETRKRISDVQKGKKLSDKCLPCSMKGKIISFETRRKLSLANRKYNLDESFFEKIDNEEKAY